MIRFKLISILFKTLCWTINLKKLKNFKKHFEPDRIIFKSFINGMCPYLESLIYDHMVIPSVKT